MCLLHCVESYCIIVLMDNCVNALCRELLYYSVTNLLYYIVTKLLCFCIVQSYCIVVFLKLLCYYNCVVLLCYIM